MSNIYTLSNGETIKLEIKAKELWSSNRVQTHIGEKYQIWCEPGQKWKDWFISSNPDGFFNLLAWLFGLRVKGVKCFCLCGAFNEDISTAFAIGSSKTFEIKNTGGELSFFPNDTKSAYGNNEGGITINIKRLN